MLPPLAVTSRPVRVADPFQPDPHRGSSQLISIALHLGAVTLLFTLGSTPQMQQAVKNMVPLVEPYWPPHLTASAPRKSTLAGGGGGGGETTPASAGHLPRAAQVQYVPPSVTQPNPAPSIVVEPTILAAPDAQLPKVDLPNLGDPFGQATIPSNGRGHSGGIGDGERGGVGNSRGPGFGPGNDPFGSVGYAGRGGVTAPIPVFRVEPEYSEEARKSKHQGSVRLAIIVDELGRTAAVKVLTPLGMGLDEKAMEAVRKWRFKPGTKNGKPIPVEAQVLVNFQLL